LLVVKVIDLIAKIGIKVLSQILLNLSLILIIRGGNVSISIVGGDESLLANIDIAYDFHRFFFFCMVSSFMVVLE
jgi:hypothetical protein